jgi:hypothetical protein
VYEDLLLNWNMHKTCERCKQVGAVNGCALAHVLQKLHNRSPNV